MPNAMSQEYWTVTLATGLFCSNYKRRVPLPAIFIAAVIFIGLILAGKVIGL